MARELPRLIFYLLRLRLGRAAEFVLGDLLETCRLVGLTVTPFMPETGPRVLTQLGFDYPYATDGNGGIQFSIPGEQFIAGLLVARQSQPRRGMH